MRASATGWSDDVARVVGRLKSLHDGDRGVSDAVALGPKVVPAMRDLLLQRDPSGLFHMRVRAVDVLAALRAYDVLAEFLRRERTIADAVEKVGDDVVIDSAARGLARSRQDWAFDLLLALAERRHFTSGVVAALGSFRRRESIPVLIAALAEDEARLSAHDALKAIGRAARPALIDSATTPHPSTGNESETSLRRRRSALTLLIEIGLPVRSWPRLRGLMSEPDTQLAALACKLCIGSARRCERPAAIARLQSLHANAQWSERIEIERTLAACGVGIGGDPSHA